VDPTNPYYRRVRLLTRILPLIAEEKCFALKGGTAINLFVRDLPRLSVDIDLVYLPMDDRPTALANIRQALGRIADTILATIPRSTVIRSYEHAEDALRLFVNFQGDRIHIELSPVLRGSVHPEELRSVAPSVEDQFGYAEIQLLSFPDLYAGKLCAALDRQHPRDLFDVRLLLDAEGIGPDLIQTFLVYLISHPRPMAELLRPTRKDIAALYEQEFQSMTQIEISLIDLLDTREEMIATINAAITDNQKAFLLSFKAGEPDWALLGLAVVEHLPAVRWKQINLDKLNKSRRAGLVASLENVLFEGASSAK
jgi:hypothetical protein